MFNTIKAARLRAGDKVRFADTGKLATVVVAHPTADGMVDVIFERNGDHKLCRVPVWKDVRLAEFYRTGARYGRR